MLLICSLEVFARWLSIVLRLETSKVLAVSIISGRKQKRIGVPGSATIGSRIEFDTEMEWIDSDLSLGEVVALSCLCTGGQAPVTAHTNAHMRKLNYCHCGKFAFSLALVTAKPFPEDSLPRLLFWDCNAYAQMRDFFLCGAIWRNLMNIN